jgi:hypothetical protein
MKFRRVTILTLAFFMVAGGAAFAGSRWGTYEGYSKVQVNVNDTGISSGKVPAFVINGSTMIPLRESGEALHSIIKWDSTNQTANIYKPNVNMIVAQDLGFKKNTVDSVSKPFFKATKGSNTAFKVFVQVDSLLIGVDGFKLSVIDPYGSEVDYREEPTPVYQDYLWYTSYFDVKFSEGGNYTLRFAFNVDGSYVTVGEKLIVSE